jgi:hypothetical protein
MLAAFIRGIMKHPSTSSGKPTISDRARAQQQDKKERLAKALRDNLRRRKAVQTGRDRDDG